MANNLYTPAATYFDTSLSSAEKNLVDSSKPGKAVNAAGNADGMAAAHEKAELLRTKSTNQTSGGSDTVRQNPDIFSVGYRAATLPKAQSMEAYINAIYSAQEELALDRLKSQYAQNVLELDNASAKIPAEYMRARNRTSSDNEIAKSAFNERAAARGLSSGAGTQATLSMNNALLGGLASISASEADALSKVELSRMQLQTAYSSNISKAIAENNLEKASALYKELVRLDQAEYTRALAQANENYRAYQTIKA